MWCVYAVYDGDGGATNNEWNRQKKNEEDEDKRNNTMIVIHCVYGSVCTREEEAKARKKKN